MTFRNFVQGADQELPHKLLASKYRSVVQIVAYDFHYAVIQ